MPNNSSIRVLGRRGARELTLEEIENITGTGKLATVATNLMTGRPKHPDDMLDQ